MRCDSEYGSNHARINTFKKLYHIDEELFFWWKNFIEIIIYNRN